MVDDSSREFLLSLEVAREEHLDSLGEIRLASKSAGQVKVFNECAFGRWLSSLVLNDGDYARYQNAASLHYSFHIAVSNYLSTQESSQESAEAWESVRYVSSLLVSALDQWLAQYK